MEESNNKVKIIIGVVILLVALGIVGYFLFLGNKKFVSPLPMDGTIRVIFVTPSIEPPSPTPSSGPTATPTKKPAPTKKASTPTPSEKAVTVTPTKVSSASATPKP